MRYVIVCLVKGEALSFHQKLVNDICYNFKIRKQKLPCHFTLKAPFETEDINTIEKNIEKYTFGKNKKPIKIKGFDHFSDAVIFMDVKLSPEALKIYDELILNLKQISFLEWRKSDGEPGYKKHFHCTVATHLNSSNYNDIWNYVLKDNVNFNSYFDNISILQWNGSRWVTYREFNLM